MKHLYTFFIFLCTFSSYAQVGIGTSTPDPSAQLEISSTDKGLLIPRVTLANRPGSPGKTAATAGLMIYQTDNDPGFYTYDGTSWEKMVKKSEVVPLGYAFLETIYNQNPQFISLNANGTLFPFTSKISSDDLVFANAEQTLLNITNTGIYKIELRINPVSVSGNSYSYTLIGLNRSGITTLSDFKIQNSFVTSIQADTQVGLRITPMVYPGSIYPTLLFFNLNQPAITLIISRLK